MDMTRRRVARATPRSLRAYTTVQEMEEGPLEMAILRPALEEVKVTECN